MIQCKYNPTKEDFIKTLRYYYRRQMGWGVLLWFLSFVQALFLIYSLIIGNLGQLTYLIIVPLMIIFFFFPYTIYFVNPVKVGKKVEADEILSGEVEYTFSEENIIIKGPVEVTTSEWSIFNRYLESEEHLLLFLTYRKNMFHFIPKRAFKSSEDITLLVNLAESKGLSAMSKPISIGGFNQDKHPFWIMVTSILPFACIGFSFLALLIFTLFD